MPSANIHHGEMFDVIESKSVVFLNHFTTTDKP